MKTNKLQKIPLILFIFLFFSPILIYGRIDTSELEKTLNEIRETNKKLQEPIASSSSNTVYISIGNSSASSNKKNH